MLAVICIQIILSCPLSKVFHDINSRAHNKVCKNSKVPSLSLSSCQVAFSKAVSLSFSSWVLPEFSVHITSDLKSQFVCESQIPEELDIQEMSPPLISKSTWISFRDPILTLCHWGGPTLPLICSSSSHQEVVNSSRVVRDTQVLGGSSDPWITLLPWDIHGHCYFGRCSPSRRSLVDPAGGLFSPTSSTMMLQWFSAGEPWVQPPTCAPISLQAPSPGNIPVLCICCRRLPLRDIHREPPSWCLEYPGFF